MTSGKILILGGGLAGLSCAVALAGEGFPSTILERRPFLGGRASSFPMNQSEEDQEEYIDNCQHVLLNSCTNLLDFYRRLNTVDSIEFGYELPFLDKNGLSVLHGSFLPAPLHLLPSFLAFKPLHFAEKIGIGKAMLRMIRLEKSLPELDRITMGDWLRQNGQGSRAIEMFWRPILVSALNEEPDRASARYGIKVFLDGVLKCKDAYHPGIPKVPLSQLYTEPSVKYLQGKGSEVSLRQTVTGIVVREGLVSGLQLADGSSLTADYFVSTVPHEVLLKLLPRETTGAIPYFKALQTIESSPITSVHLWFDRKITEMKYAALLGTEIQWMFNKSSPAAPGSCYGLVVSASRSMMARSRNDIIEGAHEEFLRLFPAARDAKLARAVVIKEPYATFSCEPGTDNFRPLQESPFRNLFVAGDWTQTGWPATMEGAVRSGYKCAELILQAEGKPCSFIRPDVKPSFLYRFLS